MKKKYYLIIIFLFSTASFIVAQSPPTANDDTSIVLVNTTLNEVAPGILSNDTDANGDTITVTEFLINGESFNVGQTANFSEGSILISADGSYVFTPNQDYFGNVSTINYTISDGTFTSSANLNISVKVPPVANDDTSVALINTTLNEVAPGILSNDTDADGDTITVTEFLINGVSFNAGQTANFSEGSILISADGSYVFTPNQDYTGNVQAINYTISDGTFTSTANLIITVYLPPEPPVARDDYDTVDINSTLNVPAPGVFINDTDINVQDVLTVTQFAVNDVTYIVGQTANLAEGNLTILPDGSYIFEPTPSYIGVVPNITYTISDGTFTSSANLLLTVEPTEDLLEITDFESCNQGFNANGEYKIVYSLQLTNRNNARDLHENALIRNIDLIDNLENAFGNGCVINVDQASVRNDAVQNIAEGTFFPREFDVSSVNPEFLNASSNSFFSPAAISDLTLYPRQSIFISFCVTVDAFCDGRIDPTPSGSSIDFTNTITANTDKGNNATNSITLSDFHSTEAIVSAGLYIPEFHSNRENPPGLANPDATYDYVNTVIITNEGEEVAQNINFNMGLDDFRIVNGISFSHIKVSASDPSIIVNENYNGDNETTLLAPNNILPPGETIVLEVDYMIGPIDNDENSYSFFNQLSLSQTQGGADGFNEATDDHRSTYTFVSWSDSSGHHLDRYYFANSANATISSDLYCSCTLAGMKFSFEAESETNKRIIATNQEPNGVLEHEEITYQITIENTSESVQLDELQLTDNLNSICNGNVISVSTPIILPSSTATTNPNVNLSYNGVSDVNIFDGTSGLLMADEIITVEFTVLYYETCIGSDPVRFTSRDPLGRSVSSTSSVNVNAFTDTDNDGVYNDVDIDNDNDTIPDVLEYNGSNPLDDDDGDFIPNYRDADFGIDTNADGIIDVFDFDNDGIPNHFDLDSDNDGILDIVEVGNISDDINRNGSTNNAVGANGLDNTKENSDLINTSPNYIIPNTDLTGNPNFIDIDSDGDGIVDNIEAQPSDNYTTINNAVSILGINTAYPNGLNPIDTESDGTPDYIDTNSDNDIRDDIIEAWDDAVNDGTQKIIPSNSDADNDGLDDAFDNDDNLVNPTNGQTPQSFPNFDNVDTPELDWREIMAIVVLINNVSEEESEDLDFELKLVRKKDTTESIESAFPINISFSTSDGTDITTQYQEAIAPYDYNSITNSSFTIPILTNNTQFTITSLEDNIHELDESFTLNGTITSNNTINTDIIGKGTIVNNDDPPSIQMNSSREDEGVDLEHVITISRPSSTPIIIDVTTRDNLAISPEDYTSISENFTINGTINPNDANTMVGFSISSHLDNLNELDEESLNVIGRVTTTNVGMQDLAKTATILDIDPNPIVEISSEETVEGNFLDFTIRLLNADAQLMQNYQPINLTLETIDNTTFANSDYESLSNQVTIPALTSIINQTVSTIDDRLNEETETFVLQANIFSTDVSNTFAPRGIGTIKDNDYPNLFSPNYDNRSDVFKISGIEDYPNFKLTIFNRLGNKVFNYSNNGRLNPLWWDGTYNGKPVPTGVYYYTLDFNDAKTKPITNFIQLIR